MAPLKKSEEKRLTKTSLARWNSKTLQNHWDAVARNLQDFSLAPSSQYYQRSEIGIIKQFLGPLKGKKFLKLDLWNEVNNTKILFWIAQQNAKVYGLDISPYLVTTAKKNFNQAGLKGEFKVSDMRQIAYPDNYFDLIYTMGTIEHVYDYDQAVREIYRVLKPGGKAILGVPNRLDPFLRPVLVWLMDKFDAYAYSPEHSFTRRELEHMLRGAGFSIKNATGVLFMPGLLRMADIFLYKYLRPMSKITEIFLEPFQYLERNYEWARRNAYLIAAVVEKPVVKVRR